MTDTWNKTDRPLWKRSRATVSVVLAGYGAGHIAAKPRQFTGAF
ncbi:hypothetical protein AAG614_03070 [Citromicrobium bathyomarinum]|jgi:hypothetical protein